MASDADRLRAERLYVEGSKSIAAIASDIGVHRSTVYEWRTEGDWDVRRRQLSDKIRQAQAEATDTVVAAAATKVRILTRLTALGILADLAMDDTKEPRDRISAIKTAAGIEAWGSVSDDEDGAPKRVVFQRSRPNG